MWNNRTYENGELLQAVEKTSSIAVSLPHLIGYGYSGYRGAQDKEVGENRMGRHAATHGLVNAGLGALVGGAAGGLPGALTAGLISGGIGAGMGAASYGIGRAFKKSPEDRVKEALTQEKVRRQIEAHLEQEKTSSIFSTYMGGGYPGYRR